MTPTILLPIDVTGGPEPAVDHALHLAEQLDATVHVLTVVETANDLPDLDADDRRTIRDAVEQQGRESIEDISERAVGRGLDTVGTVHEGSAYQRIVEYAEEHTPEYIIMGTRVRSSPSGIGMGSTTERVILQSSSPVIAIPLEDTADEQLAFEHIVIATDGSDQAERAALRGFELAEMFGADVSILYVVDTSTYELADVPRSIVGLLKEGGQTALQHLEEMNSEREVPVTTEVRRGVPDRELLSFTAEAQGDLTVMGVSGRGGVGDRFLGSTTARVLRQTTRPVLTVR